MQFFYLQYFLLSDFLPIIKLRIWHVFLSEDSAYVSRSEFGNTDLATKEQWKCEISHLVREKVAFQWGKERRRRRDLGILQGLFFSLLCLFIRQESPVSIILMAPLLIPIRDPTKKAFARFSSSPPPPSLPQRPISAKAKRGGGGGVQF